MTQLQSSNRKRYKQLSETEKGASWVYLKVGANQIAAILGRSPSTICREIKCGTTLQRDSNHLFYQQYFPETG
jgi:Transposase and inactivated derivatives, IS30 family